MNNSVTDRIIGYMKGIGADGEKEDCPISIIDINAWEWAQGVGLYGILRYYQATGDKQHLDWLIEWFDKNIEKGLPDKNINTTCPLLTLTYVYEYTKNEKYLEICREWADWLMYDLPRIDCGGFPHLVSGWEKWGLLRDLWMDTLFMAVLFLQRMGKILNKKEFCDEAARQFLVHIKYLQDNKTGLFFHGWTFDGTNNFAGALWGRGNCWFTAGAVDYLENSDDTYFAVNEFLKSSLLRQAEALKKYQDGSGMWHTLINDDTTYLESSATCGFGYGILKAVRLGYLPEEYRAVGEKAVGAIKARVAENGEVGDCSHGTGLSNDIEAYKIIPIRPMAYGQALATLLLAESMM